MPDVVGFQVDDIRFPTSRHLDGSDAMNPDPDYSAAYLRISTDDTDGAEGHGFVFTIGRGNDVQCAAIRSLEPWIVGHSVSTLVDDMGSTYRSLIHDSQLRWLGPDKGVMHMAIGAVVNALWDLRAKQADQPLWRHLSGLSPDEIVSLVDFRYLRDDLDEQQALAILADASPGRQERIDDLVMGGFPAYTTSPGWLGYDDEKLERLCREAVADGFTQVELKVGADLQDDIRRVGIARRTVGDDIRVAIDANQRWGVDEAIRWVRALSQFDVAWIEEPTSPDDIVAHASIARGVAPIPVATGEHTPNPIVFKQLLQLGAIGVLQIDATRVGGINENIANLLLAARHQVPVCPHAGGVGLCELVQHLSMFDYVAVAGTLENRSIEYVDHLHEHFVTPARVSSGRYWPPNAPGSGAEMLASALSEYRYPDSPAWATASTA